MRQIIVAEYITVNGIMEAPETWQFPFYSPDFAEYNNSQIQASGTLLLGRKTYEIFSSFWPTQKKNEFGIADKLNSTPKIVVSTTLKKADWNNSTIISKNIVEEISTLKKQEGSFISVSGSRQLVNTLLQNGLVDEIRLMVHPIVQNNGLPLFDKPERNINLKLLEAKTFSSGVTVLNYQPENYLKNN